MLFKDSVGLAAPSCSRDKGYTLLPLSAVMVAIDLHVNHCMRDFFPPAFLIKLPASVARHSVQRSFYYAFFSVTVGTHSFMHNTFSSQRDNSATLTPVSRGGFMDQR
ncbi:hypothetical protein BaRGS_00025754 [Batillaria attramentaria]|uniref:Uncharacterized protein n=1 Tax=Batillaria attramentaria TaxID=370345 RepID=A0ABD0K6B3_9CAEN